MSFLNPMPYFSHGVIVDGMSDAKGRIINNRIIDNYIMCRGRIKEDGKVIDEFGIYVGYVKNGKLYDKWGNYKGTIN